MPGRATRAYGMGYSLSSGRGLLVLKKFDNSSNALERFRRSEHFLRIASHCSERSPQICRYFFIRVVRDDDKVDLLFYL